MFPSLFHLVSLLLFVSSFPCLVLGATDRPIIGILSTVCDSYCSHASESYIAASYVKSVESAGGRVIPIPYSMSSSDLYPLLDQLNGVLFTGGDADLDVTDPFYLTFQRIMNYAKKANSKGDFFPLWGTCLGFEGLVLSYIGANHSTPLVPVNAENISLPLNFTSLAQNSRIFNPPEFGAIPATITEYLAAYPITLNNHEFGYAPELFVTNPLLANDFHVLATNLDRDGKEFVSLIEHREWPFFASQFHPEKVSFEFPRENIDHSTRSVIANAYFMQFWVSQCRLSTRRMANPDPLLIYNYQPKYIDKGFEQIYIFPIPSLEQIQLA